MIKRHSLRASDNLHTHLDTAKKCLLLLVMKQEFGPKSSILISGCHGNENTYFWLFSRCQLYWLSKRIKVVILSCYRKRPQKQLIDIFLYYMNLSIFAQIMKIDYFRHTFLKIDTWKSKMLWMNNLEETLLCKMHSLYLHYRFEFFWN